MSTIELTIAVPDFFPTEWVEPEDGEHGTLILVERRSRRIRGNVSKTLLIPFHMPGGFPRRPNERRSALIEHDFEERIRPTHWFVDGPSPWAMVPLNDPPPGTFDFWEGDTLNLTLNLRTTA